jgi:hypothetical protein
MKGLRRIAVCLAGALCAAGVSMLPGTDFAGVATACAQTSPAPTLPIPTLGPIDPMCSRVPDTDSDSVLDYEDNCHKYFNPSQLDTDKDAGPPPYEPVPITERNPVTGGDACDVDDDGDAIEDVADNCSKVANADQADRDGDRIGDACDPETTPSAGAAAVAAKLRVSGPARRLRVDEVRAGITVPVGCTAACALRATARVSRATAKRLRSGTVLARASGRLEAGGSTFLFLRVSRKVLARVRKPVRLTIQVQTDTRRATRRATLRR